MFLVIPKIARWFFSKLDSEKSSQYIFVLSIIFFSAFLAEVAGVEHIIGAFVAGLVLNKLIPHNSILMNRIDFIGNSLFIPFFLISVGMVVDYRAFFQGNWPLIIAGVLTAFAIFSKWLAAFTTAFIFRLTNTERNIIFGLSTSHAAATLAIIMVGYNTILNQKEIDAAKLINVVLEPDRLLDANVLNGTILLILITCMVASFITEMAGKKLLAEIAEDSEEGQNETRLRNQHVLVSMNELKGNETLLDFAAVISDSRVINPISVVSVHPNNEDAERTIRKSRKSLEEIMKHFAGHEMKINTIATIDMNLSSGISRVSKELVVDLVMLNDSRKLTVLKRLIGDDRQHLLDVCEKSIFFCQLDKPSINYRKIVLVTPLLAELDPAFSLWAERVLRAAKELKIDIKLFGTNNTFDRLIKVSEANNLECAIDHKEIEVLDDFFLKATKNIDDLIVVCASRIGSVSYTSDFDGFLLRVEKAYPNNDLIIIYPGQVKEKLFSNYDDVSGDAIGIGVETIQKIGKEVGSIFKKSKDLGE
jgi:NhaP-type Na+/H+ or K+/H+ antiporter